MTLLVDFHIIVSILHACLPVVAYIKHQYDTGVEKIVLLKLTLTLQFATCSAPYIALPCYYYYERSSH